MAIVEEGKYGFVIVAYSNRLCDPDQGLLTKRVYERKKNWGGRGKGRGKGTHHIHINDASFPVPNQQSVIILLVTLGNHAEKVAAYFLFAIPQRRTSGMFNMNPSAGGKGVCLTSRQLVKTYTACPVSRCS